MSNIRRCYECGSWGTQCMSDSPVDGCRCVRCASATIASLTAEVERLRACMTTAGLQCVLNGSPEQVAEHMRAVAKASVDEHERLRARCERLRDLAADASSGMVYIEGAHGRLYGVGWDRVRDKRILCEQHDDLKEPTDG